MKKILFFSPFWGRTGSELLLKDYITMLDPHKIKCAIAGRNKGHLYEEFHESIKKFDFRTFNYEYRAETAAGIGKIWIELLRFRRKLYGKLTNRSLLWQFLDGVVRQFPADMWYVNTTFMPEILEYAEVHKIRVVLHSHELEHTFLHLNPEQTRRLVNYPEHIITVAEKNTEIFETLGRNKNLHTIYPFINTGIWKPDDISRQKIRSDFGFGEKTFVWAMSGELDTNKDPLIFTEIAIKVLQQNHDAAFVWLGGNYESGYSEYVKKWAERSGFGNKIIWAGPINRAIWSGAIKEGYEDYLNAIDGMMLTSNRDSFPLVVLEAATLGKPIVAFNSGGVSEFLNHERMGLIIKSRNADLFKDALMLVMASPEKFDAAVSKKRASEFDKMNRGAEWKSFMEDL